MGKIYIDTVKYIIRADVEIVGLVEKPDVVGAIFGQTEGLLGEELDLRELQKNGRIGRIEVNIQPKGGKSIGNIEIPSSLDLVETSILAAALETVDRVGPCEAKIVVTRIEDTRNLKRKKVIERAKDLVKKLLTTEIPERKEITEAVRAEVKVAEISTYGPEHLPAGPNLDSFDSIILVEGRADVINLLKNDINNVIAIGGATAGRVPKSIIDLCRRKEATIFVDGDRGGEIIFREVSAVAELDYIARAPAGKEVEELSRKEIIKALRSRIPVEQEAVHRKEEPARELKVEQRESAQPTLAPTPEAIIQDIEKIIEKHPVEHPSIEKKSEEEKIPNEIMTILGQLEGTLNSRIYDEQMNLIKEVPVRDVTKELDVENAYAVVLDGIITQRLVDIAESKNIKIIAGIKMGNIFRKPEKLKIYVKEE